MGVLILGLVFAAPLIYLQFQQEFRFITKKITVRTDALCTNIIGINTKYSLLADFNPNTYATRIM